MGENSNQNDQQKLGASNNNDCSSIVGTSSLSTMVKIEDSMSSHNYPSNHVISSLESPQSQEIVQKSQDSSFIHLPPSSSSSCTDSVPGAHPSSTTSSLSSSSSNFILPQTPEQSAAYVNHQQMSSFQTPGSTMNSTFNSSLSSLDRGSPTLGNQNLNHNNNIVLNTADYLAQLLKDRKQLSAFPNVFHHVERLIDDGMFTFSHLCFRKEREMFSKE